MAARAEHLIPNTTTTRLVYFSLPRTDNPNQQPLIDSCPIIAWSMCAADANGDRLIDPVTVETYEGGTSCYEEQTRDGTWRWRFLDDRVFETWEAACCYGCAEARELAEARYAFVPARDTDARTKP